MTGRDRNLLLVAAAATSVLLLLAALAGHAELVAYAAPVCVIALPLLAGRYLGERTLERLRARTARELHPRPAATVPATRRELAAFPRGGRLIARALAERGPPVPALA